ncbi:MAG TPA: immunoglobulin domain-containing protein [Candidatus Sulfotelmatobacter sp.]|nr:immunoglobulin domain-containing protein [Candidatus Sulfotelmatobacter sp.]
MYCRFLLFCAAAVLLNLIAAPIVRATPYASGITVTNGSVIFYLNEAGGNVTVTYEDGSTNASFNGITTGLNEPAGQYSFQLGTHTGYAISVYKQGNGVPFQISNDSSNFSIWSGDPRGVAVNKNPQFGRWFGRIYAGEAYAAAGSGASAKYPGIYAANADFSDALGQGTNPFAGTYYNNPTFIAAEGTGDTSQGASYSFPYKMRVAPDGSLLVVDGFAATPTGDLLQFTPDLDNSNFIFSQTQPNAASIHGDLVGTPDLLITNTAGVISQALWIFDSGLASPGGETFGPNAPAGEINKAGNYNNAFLYDIGTNYDYPWTNEPVYAYSVGLGGLSELHPEGDIGIDGKIICGFERANGSDPDVQILDPTGSTILWTSWVDTGGIGPDPWAGVEGPVGGVFAGVRESPDGRYLAGVDIDNGITLASMTNGLPDDSSLFHITNNPETGDSRGMDWDAADNIYVISSGQGLLRAFSLGLTTTCVTSNDITGTNGTFSLTLPPVSVTVVTTTEASQNYINSNPPGTPIPGVFTITLSTNSLTAPTVVNFNLSGTAILGTNYTVATGTDPNGVVITTTNVTFPAGTYPGSGNWVVNVQIVPTATPVSGPTLTVDMKIPGGADYFAGSPSFAPMTLMNTGPQVLFLTAASFGTGMSRNVTNDYAQFSVTRWGDLSHSSYTVTNISYGGTGSYPADFAAGAQRLNINIQYFSPPYPATLQNGAPGIVINPGDVTVTAAIGNPVPHSNLSAPPKDATIVISLTNSVTGTNLTSSEGASYSVTPASVTLTELDNAVGPEVVLWSDPLTNSVDSTNWTLTYDATNLTGKTGFGGRVLPVLIPNFTNDESARIDGGTNDFRAEFGMPVANDGVPLSQVMAQKGWANALKMTANKDGGDAQAAVNLYPQGRTFAGNYALRFNMYLSLYDGAIGTPGIGSIADEFAIFGINHTGTNCNWRLPFTDPVTPGYNAPVNADGDWFAIDAGYGSVSPADFDSFASPKLPNRGIGVSGGVSDIESSSASSQIGVFKSPPFVSEDNSAGALAPGGEAVDQWVNVSVEVTQGTNVSVYINRTQVIPSFSLNDSAAVNGGFYTNGTPMLGYLDPNAVVSDPSAYVYYSNVRIVELSPYLTSQPASVIATNGANVSFTASADLATAPLTDVWYTATGSVPVAPVLTNTAAATNLTSTLALNDVQTGNNFVSVFSDAAGPVTNQAASLEVVGVTNVTVAAGANAQLSVTASGQSAPTSYQWMFNGTNLANSSHYAGVTTATLTITNAQSADAGAYSVAVVNAAGTATPSGMLSLIAASRVDISSVSIQGNDTIGNFTSSNPSDTTSSFTLQSSVVVEGPYTNNTAAVFTGGSGTFQFSVPITTNATMFYRLVHN